MGVFHKLFFFFGAVLILNVDLIHAKKPTVVCYVAAWASFRGKFSVSNIDTQHCTHVIYAFMGLNKTTSEIRSVDPLLDLEEGGKGKGQLKELKNLKILNPNITLLASVGGYSEASKNFSEMAASSARKATFINSLVKFIRKWELDGIDICWQFPGQRGGRSDDRKNFVNLLKEIKAVFKPEGWLLTVHIIAKRTEIVLGYDLKSIAQTVDYINYPAVEFHGPWLRKTGIMAPLNSSNENNVIYMVEYIVNKTGMPRKVLLGLPTYGHAYITEKKISSTDYLNQFSDKAFASPWTNEPGIIAYNEICMNLKNGNGWNEGFDENSSTPIAYKDNIFVSFDNEKSLIEKAKLVSTYKLGGIMLWSLDMDDFLGECHNKSYPMLSAVTDFLKSEGEKTSQDKTENNGTNFRSAVLSKMASDLEKNKHKGGNEMKNTDLFISEEEKVSQNKGENNETNFLRAVPFRPPSYPEEDKQQGTNSSISKSTPNKSGNQVYQSQTLTIVTMSISFIFYKLYL